jgi:type I restriction enzyme, R subunit
LPVTVEQYKQRMAEKLVKEIPSLETFRTCWIDPRNRRGLINTLVTGGYSPLVIQRLEEMADYDLYDVLAELGYGMAPQTRGNRADAFGYKHAGWLNSLPDTASATLKTLASQFASGGTESLENPHIFELPEVVRAGGLSALSAVGKPAEILHQTKERIFAA